MLPGVMSADFEWRDPLREKPVVDATRRGGIPAARQARSWGGLMRLVRPKSLKKLRGKLKRKTRRTNGESMEAIAANLNRTLKSWYAYFKHAHPGELVKIAGWIRMRLRSILRKRKGCQGRGRGRDHQRWPNHYFTGLGFFCPQEARAAEIVNLRNGANR
jgi:hypothetical protein